MSADGIKAFADVMGGFMNESGRVLAKKLDQLIAEQVTKHLGRSDWTLEEFAKRARAEKHCDLDGKVLITLWYLDENLILETYPPDCRTTEEGHSRFFHVDFNYRRHDP